MQEIIAWNLPAGDIRWHVVAEAKARNSAIVMRPDGKEFVTSNSEASFWDQNGKHLRDIPLDFLCGDLIYSKDQETLIVPAGNQIKFRSIAKGCVSSRFAIHPDSYTSATTVAHLKDDELLVGCRVIDSKGAMSGKLMILDRDGKVKRTSRLEMIVETMSVDFEHSLACVGGTRRGRGYVAFWDLAKWKLLSGSGAHGSGIDRVTFSPDGKLVASCGVDSTVRLWSAESRKTIAKLEEQAPEGSASSNVAWSPDGKFLAYAHAGGKSPKGGVLLYEQDASDGWQLSKASRSALPDPSSASKLRHFQVWGSDNQMDRYGNFGISANTWPTRCPDCTFPDIDAAPQPYYLRKGASAPGDFAIADLGNFFVQAKARQLLETVLPDACEFFPTIDFKTSKKTNWMLAVPQYQFETAAVAGKLTRCQTCGEPKSVVEFKELEFNAPAVDIFKSKQWRGVAGEEQTWYWMHILKLKERPATSKTRWTRVGLSRELWFSARLAFLFKETGLTRFPYRDMEGLRPTPAELNWV